jgi:putative transposase
VAWVVCSSSPAMTTQASGQLAWLFSGASPLDCPSRTGWQRCQFHLQQNAQAYVPRKEMQTEVAEDIRTIFNAPDRATAEAYLAKAVEKYRKSASRLAAWMPENISEGLTVFSFPAAHRRLLRTTNGVERLHREVRRRARVVLIFPNQASCLRLVSAILNEISEEWLTGRTYLSFQGSD